MLSFLIKQTLVLVLSLSTVIPSFRQVEDASKTAMTYLKKIACSTSEPRIWHDRYFLNGSRRAIPVKTYRGLPGGQPLSRHSGATYYSFKTLYGSRVHLVIVDLDSGDWDLRPAVNATVDTTTHSAQSRSAAATINGGYFGLSDGASVSYVVVDGKEEASPRRNPSLLANTSLSGGVKNAIYNRSEFRILVSDDGKNHVTVAHHDQPIPNGYRLVHSLQAGPRLLPELTVEKEAFVRQENGKTVDVIRSRQMVARTAFGVTGDRKVVMLCVEGGEEQQGRGGATLLQLRQIMLDLGCVDALNLDGGSSSTMYVSYPDSDGRVNGHTVCRNNPERRVKSVLLLFPRGTGRQSVSSQASKILHRMRHHRGE
jgi:hypothetical protein